MQGGGRRHIALAGRLHLNFEHRQRRAQLVRGIAHKAFLVAEQIAQPLNGAVHAVDPGLQLAWHSVALQGLEVMVRPLVDGVAHLAHGTRDALHDDHDGQHQQAQQHGVLPQGLGQQVQGQVVAQLQGFGHLDDGHAAPRGAGHGL